MCLLVNASTKQASLNRKAVVFVCDFFLLFFLNKKTQSLCVRVTPTAPVSGIYLEESETTEPFLHGLLGKVSMWGEPTGVN